MQTIIIHIISLSLFFFLLFIVVVLTYRISLFIHLFMELDQIEGQKEEEEKKTIFTFIPK
jgi:hypothetical protein